MNVADNLIFSIFSDNLMLSVLFYGREEISKSRYNSMIGLVDRERIDKELYDDFESDKAREVVLSVMMKPFYG